MELLGKIRRMHLRDKISERTIAKRTGLSRNTVHKWLQTPEEVEAPKYVRAKKFGKLAGFADELDKVKGQVFHKVKGHKVKGQVFHCQIAAQFSESRRQLLPPTEN